MVDIRGVFILSKFSFSSAELVGIFHTATFSKESKQMIL